MSPSISTTASTAPAASSPASRDEAQPLPYASLWATSARAGRDPARPRPPRPPTTSTTWSSDELDLAQHLAEQRGVAERQRLLGAPQRSRRPAPSTIPDHAQGCWTEPGGLTPPGPIRGNLAGCLRDGPRPLRARQPGGRRSRPSPRSRGRSSTSVAVGQRLLDAVEAAQVPPRLSIKWTSVASRVHGTTGLPCSSLPWWARMMWTTASARAGGKPSIVLDLAPDAVVAERDLADQLPASVSSISPTMDAYASIFPMSCSSAPVTATSRSIPGKARPSRSRPGPPTGSARAARGGRPGGSAWPPGPSR